MGGKRDFNASRQRKGGFDMIRSVAMAVCAFLFLCSGKETAHAETAKDLLSSGSYLAVENVARSRAFYSALFGGEPVVLKGFVAYDISGG